MVSKVTFKLRLSDFIEDSSKLSADEKARIKKEVGELVIRKIKADAHGQKSSVTGKNWKGLSKDYKKIKSSAIGSFAADLELTGAMWDSMTSEPYNGGLEIGVFDPTQAKKMDNHNKVSAASRKTKLPKRQSIPKKGESLRTGIMKEVTALAQSILDESETEEI